MPYWLSRLRLLFRGSSRVWAAAASTCCCSSRTSCCSSASSCCCWWWSWWLWCLLSLHIASGAGGIQRVGGIPSPTCHRRIPSTSESESGRGVDGRLSPAKPIVTSRQQTILHPSVVHIFKTIQDAHFHKGRHTYFFHLILKQIGLFAFWQNAEIKKYLLLQSKSFIICCSLCPGNHDWKLSL